MNDVAVNRHTEQPAGGIPETRLSVVFLAGAARSGGTLVEFILARRFDFFPVGELIYIWERGFIENQLCSCGAPFGDCPFWQAVSNHAFGEDAPTVASEARDLQKRLVRTRAVPRLLGSFSHRRFTADLSKYRDMVARLYRSVAHVSGASAVVDSSRSGAYGLILMGIPDLDLRVVHLIRDSRAYAYSRTRLRSRPEIVGADAHMLRTGVAVSSREWVRLNLLAEILCRGSAMTSRLRYEDFAADPEGSLRSIRPLLDTDALPDGATPTWLSDVGYHSVSGNPVRFTLSVPEIRLDDEWLTAMDRRNRAVVSSLTLPLLVRYGYLPGRPNT
jgi:sulfotransferase family protein